MMIFPLRLASHLPYNIDHIAIYPSVDTPNLRALN